jgi:hypothetical protein
VQTGFALPTDVVHALPHAPQFAGSVWNADGARHAPPHNAYPGSHARLHVPEAHVGDELRTLVVQALPHEPQLFTSDWKLEVALHAPSHIV